MAWMGYFPLGSEMSVNFGPTFVATGSLYKNEYGIMVLANENGISPLIFFTPNIINAITTLPPEELRSEAGKAKKSDIPKKPVTITGWTELV